MSGGKEGRRRAGAGGEGGGGPSEKGRSGQYQEIPHYVCKLGRGRIIISVAGQSGRITRQLTCWSLCSIGRLIVDRWVRGVGRGRGRGRG